MYKHIVPLQHCRLGTDWLGRSFAEKALRVLVGSELSPGSRKAKKILGCTTRSRASRLMDVIITSSSALIRLYPEYCIQFWSEFSRGPPGCWSPCPVRRGLWDWGGSSWLRDGFGSAYSSPQHPLGKWLRSWSQAFHSSEREIMHKSWKKRSSDRR